METHESFLNGFKPSYLCSRRYESDALQELHRLNYPYVIEYELEDFDNPGTLYDVGTLFFQTEQIKSDYLDAISKTNSKSGDGTYLLGVTLGFPPVACRFFVEASNDEELSKKRAGFRYYGYRFAGNVDDVEEIVSWLWSNVPAPVDGVEVEYDNKIRIVEPAVVT